MTDATIITSDDEGPCVSEPMTDPDESGPLPRTLAVSSSSLLSQPSLYTSSSELGTTNEHTGDLGPTEAVPIWTAPSEGLAPSGVPTPMESSPMTATTPMTPTTTPTAPSRTAKIPWYAGAEHCVEWPVRSPGSGFLSVGGHAVCLNECCVAANPLSSPSQTLVWGPRASGTRARWATWTQPPPPRTRRSGRPSSQ